MTSYLICNILQLYMDTACCTFSCTVLMLIVCSGIQGGTAGREEAIQAIQAATQQEASVAWL